MNKEEGSIDHWWRSKVRLSVLWLFLAVLLGGASAFVLFAMAFNSAAWTPLVLQAILLAVCSAIVGLKVKFWRSVLYCFYLPHLLFFALLVKGSLERGEWGSNILLISLVTAAIWLPAIFLIRKQKA
ncbi:hypothetical protein [Bdellovibrio sp. HCB2-146]|uniref:hypothetical protein n=1 Tax=Bdellovibrio sp. HCB2-146 TaxID=3394362 RepID=UPI0039BD10B3